MLNRTMEITSYQRKNKFELSDSALIALTDAIEVYKDFIKEKIEDRVEAPYWASLQGIKEVERSINSIGFLSQLVNNNIYLSLYEIDEILNNYPSFKNKNGINISFKDYYMEYILNKEQ
jgi:hypothetical protein